MPQQNAHLHSVVREFLSRYRYIYEVRLQHLLYHAELVSIQTQNERFTNAVFEPLAKGPFSEQVRAILDEEITPPKSLVRHDGGKVYKYTTLSVTRSETLNADDRKIIQQVMDETEDLSTEELITRHTNTAFFEQQEVAEPINFEALNE